MTCDQLKQKIDSLRLEAAINPEVQQELMMLEQQYELQCSGTGPSGGPGMVGGGGLTNFGNIDENSPDYNPPKWKLGDPLYTRPEIEGAIPGLDLSSFPGIGDMSTPEQSLAASFAGLQELQQGQADFAKRDAQDPFNGLSYFQVNPYQGNFAQMGGFMGMDAGYSPMRAAADLVDLARIGFRKADPMGKVEVAGALKNILELTSSDPSSYSYQQGGMPMEGEEGNQFVPIQAESVKGKPEQFIFEDGTTSPTKATKPHSKMSEEEVTDIVPEGTYVASVTPKMRIPKDFAEQYELGVSDQPYKLDKKGKQLKQITLADYYGTKKKQTPADLVNKINKKHPILEAEEDDILGPYRQQANNFVFPFRQNVFSKLIDMSEQYKEKLNTDEVLDNLQTIMQYAAGPQQYRYGGKVMRKNTKKYEDGGSGFDPFGPIVDLGLGIFDRISAGNNKRDMLRRIEEAYDKGMPIFEEGVRQREQQRGLGLGAGMIGLLSQDPTVRSYGRSPEFSAMLADLRTREDRTRSDYAAANRVAANQAMRNISPLMAANARMYGPAGAAAMAGTYSQGIADASSNTALQGAERLAALRASYADRMNQLRTPALQDIYAKLNQTTSNQNALLGNMGSLGSQYFNTGANLASQDAAFKIAFDQWRVASKNNAALGARQDIMNANYMLGDALKNAYNSIDWNPTSTGPGLRDNYWDYEIPNPDTGNRSSGRYTKMGGYPSKKQVGGFSSMFSKSPGMMGRAMMPSTQGSSFSSWLTNAKNRQQPAMMPSGMDQNPYQNIISSLLGGMRGGSGGGMFGGIGGGSGTNMLSALGMFEKGGYSKKEAINKYQTGGNAENPYGSDTELGRLWTLFNERELSPSEALIAYARGNAFDESDGSIPYVAKYLRTGDASSEYERIMQQLSEKLMGTDPLTQTPMSYYEDANTPGGRVYVDAPESGLDFVDVTGAEFPNEPGIILNYDSALSPDKTYHIGSFYPKKPAFETKKFKTKKEAKDYERAIISTPKFGEEIPEVSVEKIGDEWIVHPIPKLSAAKLPTMISTTGVRPPEDIAKLVAMGFNPDELEEVTLTEPGQKTSAKVSPSLASRILGPSMLGGQKLAYRLINGELQPVHPALDSSQYQRILTSAKLKPEGTRVIERYFGGKDPLLSLTLPIKGEKKKSNKKK